MDELDQVLASSDQTGGSPRRGRGVLKGWWVYALPVAVLAGGSIFALTSDDGNSGSGAVAADDTTTLSSQPTDAVTSTSAEVATTATATVEMVDWDSVEVPLDCSWAPVRVVSALVVEPTPHAKIAVVEATCEAGAGSPPSVVLVYDGADSATSPRLAQTLIAHDDNWLVATNGISARGPQLSVSVLGYSTHEVPRCCPDLSATLTWTWANGRYQLVGTPPDHARSPSPG